MRRFRNIWWLYMFPAGIGLTVFLETRMITVSVFIALIVRELLWTKEQLPFIVGKIADVYVDLNEIFHGRAQETIKNEGDEEPDPELRGRARRRETGGNNAPA